MNVWLKMGSSGCRLALTAFLAIAGCAGVRAEVVGMPEENDGIYGLARGYWFSAPVDFQITGIHVLSGSWIGNSYMNWAVVRFNGALPPPNFPASTSDFVQLGLRFNEPADSFSAVRLNISAGDVIGIYGNTSAEVGGIGDVSYGGPDVTATIFGHTVALNRTGMQFDLTSTSSPLGMHDIWAEDGLISRVEFTYAAVPEPAVGILTLLLGGGLAVVRMRQRSLKCSW